MSEPVGLHTLAYRVDPEGLGNLAVYPLNESFVSAWESLTSKIRRRAGRDEIVPRYSDLATALTAVTGQAVRLFPKWDLSDIERQQGVAALLVTTEPIEPWILETACRAFERQQTRDEKADTLSQILAGTQPETGPLSSFVSNRDGAVMAPGWIYRVAQWNLAAKVAAAPLLVDDRLPIKFRLDTDANLVAWDDPIIRSTNAGTRSAMVYLDTSIVTLPGASYLYFRLDARMARMPSTWSFVKNTWVDRGDFGPLLKLPIRPPWPERGRRIAEYASGAAEIVRECGLDPLALPTPLPDLPGAVRPIGNPRFHPVGKGPGARLIFQIQHQLAERLGLPELVYRRTPLTVGKPATGRVSLTRLDAAVEASGSHRLRVVGLYGTDATRSRMADALGAYCAADPTVLAGVDNDVEVSVSKRLSVQFHRAPEIIAHGALDRDLDGLSCLHASDGEAVVALVETEWVPGTTVDNDAKPILRAELGKRGIVTQFLSGNHQPVRPGKQGGAVKSVVDHQAEAAGRDLFRQTGLIDDRLATATSGPGLRLPLTRPATLVGIHVRQRTPRWKNGAKETNRLVVQMVAIHATADIVPWSIQMYDDDEGWLSYRAANANYFARDAGRSEFSRNAQQVTKVRDYVDQALAALPKADPLVIFTDAEACRRIWKGLTNGNFGQQLLPGATSGHPDVAVVRCASGPQVPRVSHRSHGSRVADKNQPDLPGTTLYEHNEDGTVSWLLAQPSRVHRSSKIGARAGTMFTRWTLPEKRDQWMKNDWHALTAIEIAVAQTGSWEPSELAALTARLCHQTASWDDRTRLPTPLHLAKCSDEDHPGHPPTEDSDAVE